MGRVSFLLLLLIAAVVGVAYYRGWFEVAKESSDQKTNITISLDQQKFQADKEKAQEKVQELERTIKDKTTTSSSKDKDDGSNR